MYLKIIRYYKTPILSHSHVVIPEGEEKTFMEYIQKNYQSGLGSLLYFIRHTRPDICNIVIEISK